MFHNDIPASARSLQTQLGLEGHDDLFARVLDEIDHAQSKAKARAAAKVRDADRMKTNTKVENITSANVIRELDLLRNHLKPGNVRNKENVRKWLLVNVGERASLAFIDVLKRADRVCGGPAEIDRRIRVINNRIDKLVAWINAA